MTPITAATKAPEQSARSPAARYGAIRSFSIQLSEPLQTEDLVVQSMPDASPTKWHLAHTTWFFETFILEPCEPGYRPFDPAFGYLFNSYYNAVGERHPRPKRGLLTRPTVRRVMEYRRNTDQRIAALVAGADEQLLRRIGPILEIGLQHEQQHQELILTDVKHLLSCNPLKPAYRPGGHAATPESALTFTRFDEAIREIGHRGDGFAFDNESPRHRVLVGAFEIADRPVTCGEFIEFIADGGYGRADLWLDLGWTAVRRRGWAAPMYWRREGDRWTQFTLSGERPVDPNEPVCHISFFEADAFARWADARLPTEQEWETAAAAIPIAGNFAESGRFHPGGPASAGSPGRMFGDVWEWTRSDYGPYPGYRPPPGAIGEYNGKFMCQQYVLRGGSCATGRSHIRPTYRNFFPPDARWQFSGVRLARDAR